MSPRPVRTAVIPVAGLGTRFLPVTKSVPKEMLPIVDKPCIEYVVAEAVEAGIERVVFVTSRGKDALVDYFDRSPSLEAHLERAGKEDLLAEVRRVAALAEVVAVRQQVALGLGHAVLTALPAIGQGEDVAVLLGDDIVDAEVPAIGQLLTAREASGAGAVVALMEVPRDQTDRYGVCAGDFESPGRMRVSAMVEKPAPADAPSNFAIVGRYVLPAEIFDILTRTTRGRGGEIQLTDAIAVLAARGQVVGQVLDGTRHDTGNVLGLLRASLHFAWQRPDLRPGLKAMLAELAELE
jgi:UTP--glucose-1-phosphate uridylyltransferase